MRYIKVEKSRVDNNEISIKVGAFANIKNLNLDNNEYFRKYTFITEKEGYYYILAIFYDLENKNRNYESSIEETIMIEDFVRDNNLTFITAKDYRDMFSSEF